MGQRIGSRVCKVKLSVVTGGFLSNEGEEVLCVRVAGRGFA
jgi:hypothetical protein